MTAVTHLPISQSNSITHSLPVSAQVYRRRRIGVSALLAVTVFFVSLFGGELLGRVTGKPGSPSVGATSETSIYIVEAGDTLWEIARVVSPPGRDIRITVDDLAALNGGSSVVPGQRLIVPFG